MSILCTICMRGGSKGVPNKNLRILNGKPLMAHTIEQALESGLSKFVVVSTDSERIAAIAKEFGAVAWFLRPSELATDDAPKLPVIRHALKEAENYYGQLFDVLIDLDATSPLRYVEDILNAYNQFVNDNSDILISASPARKNPYFNMVELINGKVHIVKPLEKPLTRRQDSPIVFDMNASIYIWKRKALLEYNTLFTNNTSLYVMPEERSVDIDTEMDWDFVEYIINKNIK
jgi:CMP-N,N'-diacetyllegionaminic acid synthase